MHLEKDLACQFGHIVSAEVRIFRTFLTIQNEVSDMDGAEDAVAVMNTNSISIQ